VATTPGAMSLYDLQCRILHLLFEPGPDTTGVAVIPTTGDFPATTLTRDLNIWLGMYIGLTGMAPAMTDVVQTEPIVAGLDFALPANCASLVRVEYTPAGQYPYTLVGKSFDEFDSTTGGIVPPATGQPYYYRQPFGGLIRMQPQPGPGNAGQALATLTLSGTPTAGNQVTATLAYGALNVTTTPYTVLSTDTLASIATALAAAINASSAVSGAQAFLATATVPLDGPTVQLTSLATGTGGNAITAYGTVTGSTLQISPTIATALAGGGVPDEITIYFESLGSILVNPTDMPGIPAQFNMAPAYGCLSDYWLRKGDLAQAKAYEGKFDRLVRLGKQYVFDNDRSTQPTLAGEDVDVNYADGIVG